MINCKCKGCEQRHPHCHKDREDYAKYKAEIEKKNKVQREYTEEARQIVNGTPRTVNHGNWRKNS